MQKRGGGNPGLFAAIVILGITGWYIYNHYIKNTRQGMGGAYRIEAARRDNRVLVERLRRYLLAMPARIYLRKAIAIDHELFIAAHPPPTTLKAISATAYAKTRVVAWFLVLFPGQMAPLAAAMLFIFLKYYRWRIWSMGEMYTGFRIENRPYIADMSFNRADCRDMPLYERVKNSGCLSKATKATLETLAAYKEWPASIRGHMAGVGGLIDHTDAVLTEVIKLVEEGRDNIKDVIPLNCAVTAALAHDLGKILVYKKQGDSWVSDGMYHDSLSASILYSLPEFHKEYGGIEKESILLAVKYHHSPLALPINGPPLARKLLRVLQKADNIASRREGEMRELKEDISPQLEKAFYRALPELNINRWQGGNADGWLQDSTVFVLEHTLREKVYRYLDEQARGWFTGDRKDGRVHPLWTALYGYLADNKLLREEINGVKSNKGFFDLKVDGTVFQCVAALDGATLDMPEEWNLGQQVNIEVLGSKDKQEEA